MEEDSEKTCDLSSCGYSKEEVLAEEISKHSCLQIFEKYFVEVSGDYFWAMDTNGQAVYELSESDLKEILNKQKKKSPKDLIKKKIDLEEILILEVQKRPALYDHISLGLDKRSNNIKKRLWEEVSNIVGSFTADSAKKKFKSLADTYRNIVRNEKSPSGSARKNSSASQKWVHYYTMDFLRPFVGLRPTSSSFDKENNRDIDAEESNDSTEASDLSNSQPRKTLSLLDTNDNDQTKKRKRNHSKTSENDLLCESFNKVADAISSSSSQINLPAPPVLDEVEASLALIGCRLRKLPEEHQSDAVQDIVHYSMELLKKYKT